MSELVVKNSWDFLKQYTDARIALGRTGHSLPTKELLDFQLAHAQAKDAVSSELRMENGEMKIHELGLETIRLHSQARDRREYLKRPDLGRKLTEDSWQILSQLPAINSQLSIAIVDGLSATAIHTNAIPFLELFVPLAKEAGISLSPISIVTQGRVAIGDEIGHLLKAEIVAVLIGERPGLSSPDSMGIYMTYNPQPGLTDESRNCISNIRPKGLSYKNAALKLLHLTTKACYLKISGVNLKDELILD